tara:strand:- start:292 stop:1068 length:777 start_codon:yes stop_codon:yes gene_type:complete
VGFVPTMGALHEGHLSLIKKSKKSCDNTVVSIFVNPKQFSPNEDFKVYPRNLDKDVFCLERCDVDALFFPDEKMIYPKNFSTYVDESLLSLGLEGCSRPHFFKGVLTVVLKLFNIISPQSVFFGKKDYQQLRLIQKMVEDLNLNISVVGCETIRERGGLAMSSRNEVFSSEEKEALGVIYSSLSAAKKEILSGKRDVLAVKKFIEKILLGLAGVRVDYIDITDIERLVSVEKISEDSLISLAVFFKDIRLIDNIEVKI